MASTINSIDTDIKGLAPSFQTAIKATIESESNPLQKVQAQKDAIDLRRSIYTDLKTNFDGLQSALQALISTQASYGMRLISKTTVTPGTAGTTVLSATNSESAIAADYDLTVTQLAKAQSKATVASYSVDMALGKTGTFRLGGSGTAALQTRISTSPDIYSDFVTNDVVTQASTSAVERDQRELGTGDYALETRDSSGVRQFRLVNADGVAVSIRTQAGTSYTSEWQNMTDGSYDTGRGLNLTLATTGTTASTALTYTAAGTSLTINSSDTLRNIANAINAIGQPEGRDFKASIVANKLVLTGAQTGENHGLLFTDGAGLGFGADLQSAQNAKFSINGMAVSRATNDRLSDVVNGITINLSSDAEGKSARLSIVASADKSAALMKTMVDKFNAALTHLKDKLASTPTTVGEKTTYKRGPLSGDAGFSSLRLDLLRRLSRNYSNSGTLKNFSEIGLSFDADMKLVLDSSKFSEALKTRTSDVTALLDTGLGELNSVVSRYAGSGGFLSNSLTSIDTQRTSYDRLITKYNDNLTVRKKSLYNQYLSYQNQIADYGRTAQMFGIITGTTTNTSG
jgi:flagellar hook-associated protein 2